MNIYSPSYTNGKRHQQREKTFVTFSIWPWWYVTTCSLLSRSCDLVQWCGACKSIIKSKRRENMRYDKCDWINEREIPSHMSSKKQFYHVFSYFRIVKTCFRISYFCLGKTQIVFLSSSRLYYFRSNVKAFDYIFRRCKSKNIYYIFNVSSRLSLCSSAGVFVSFSISRTIAVARVHKTIGSLTSW